MLLKMKFFFVKRYLFSFTFILEQKINFDETFCTHMCVELGAKLLENFDSEKWNDGGSDLKSSS